MLAKLFPVWNQIHDCIKKLSWAPPLVARVSVGLMFMGTGWGKIHNIPKVTEFFTNLGIPAPGFHAHVVALSELCCGTALVVGFLVRFASIPLLVTMTVAILTAKRSEINELNDLLGMSEYLLGVVLFWLFVEGGGPLTLDHLITRKLRRK